MDFEDHHPKLFVCSLPSINFSRLSRHHRSILVYLSGALFAISWWVFIDAIIQSNLTKDNPSVPFVEDYIVGSIATLGMIIVNSLDPGLIAGDSFHLSGSILAWKARLFLFCGITANVGSFIGAVAVACFKYYIPGSPVSYVGHALIVQTFGILISSLTLWMAQSMEEGRIFLE